MLGFLSKILTLNGLAVLLILALLFQHCGMSSSFIEGVWMAPVGPYERLYLRFEGRTCRMDVFDGETWTKSREGIDFEFRKKDGRLHFVHGETRHTFRVAFFHERGREYIRLLFYRREGKLSEQESPPSPFEVLLRFYVGETTAKTLFFEKLPKWVQNQRATDLPSKALTGLWIGRDGKGEDGSALYFSNPEGEHIQIIAQDRAGLSGRPMVFRNSTRPGHFRLKPADGADSRGAVFEFFDRERIRLEWLDSGEKSADASAGTWFVKQPKPYGRAFERAVQIGREQGIGVSFLRPSFFARDPERHAGAFSPEHGEAVLAALDMIEMELGKYPRAFVSAYVDQIVLAPMSGTRDPLLPGHAQVHREKRILFVDPLRTTSPCLFHHLFFQLVDAQYMGRDRFLRKTDWLAVSRRHGFAGRYDRAAVHRPLACSLVENGFLNDLAKRGYGDDRAQVFAALMTEGGPCQPEESLAGHMPTVEKIYLLYENYPLVLEPYIQSWVGEFGLPVRRPRPLPATPNLAKHEPDPQPVETVEPSSARENPGPQTVVQQRQKEAKPTPAMAVKPKLAKKKASVEKLDKQKSVVGKKGRMDIYLTVASKAARDKWKEVVLVIDGKTRPSVFVEDPKQARITSLETGVGTHTMTLGGQAYNAPQAIGFQVEEGLTTKIDYVIKGRKGNKLRVLVNEKLILEENLEKKAGDP